MRRRRRAPTTQLARAGERTRILVSDEPVEHIRFRASVLDGAPRGSIEIETDQGTRTADLAGDNLIDATGFVSMSVVPRSDTAITFVPPQRAPDLPALLGGGVLLLAALGWTAYDILLG